MVDKLARTAAGMDEVPLPCSFDRRIVEVLAVRSQVGILSFAVSKCASGAVQYLDDGRLPEARKEARRIRRKAARFLLMDEILYKQEFLAPLLRCISAQEAKYVLAEIHKGKCKNHSERRALARKAI